MDNLDFDGMESLEMLEAKRKALIMILNLLVDIPLATDFVAMAIYEYDELIDEAKADASAANGDYYE